MGLEKEEPSSSPITFLVTTMRLHLSRSDFESLGVFSQNRYRYKKHSSRKLECVSFKMGYRGLPVRKHSAWDPFRRP